MHGLGALQVSDDPRDSIIGALMSSGHALSTAVALRGRAWVVRVDTIDAGLFQLAADVIPWGVDSTNADWLHAQLGVVGQGVKVAILDDGLNCTLSDVAPNYNGGYDYPGGVANGCVYGSTDTSAGWHGTSVAGIVAAYNDGAGIVGMAPRALISMLRVCYYDQYYHRRICPANYERDALQWAMDHGMQVINMSFGNCGQPPPPEYGPVYEKLVAAAAAGIQLVASAGNGASGGCAPLPGPPYLVAYPAAYPEVIAVSAVSPDGSSPVDYQYGPDVEIAAPTNVTTLSSAGGTRVFAGTSAAAPHVTGAIAAMLSNGIVAVRSALQRNARDLGVAGRDTLTGFGMLRADRSAVLEARVTGIAGQSPILTPGKYAYTASTTGGYGSLSYDWVVDYVLDGVPQHQTWPNWSSQIRVTWPAGNYTATITATPREVLWDRIGWPSTTFVSVCTEAQPVASEHGGATPRAHAGCGGGGGGDPVAPFSPGRSRRR